MSAVEADLTTPTTSTTNTSEGGHETKPVEEASEKIITDNNLTTETKAVEETTNKVEDTTKNNLESTEEDTKEVGQETTEETYSPVFVSPKLQKIHEFTYLLTQQDGWSAGELYSFYFPKTSIAAAIDSEYGKCEGDKQACKTMLDKLHTYVATKLNALLEDFSTIRDNSTDADHIIGLVQMAMDVHKAITVEELAIDASAIATSIDKFHQLVGQLSHSSAVKQKSIRQKLVPDTTQRKMTANRSNGVVVFEEEVPELNYAQKFEDHIERILKKDFRLGAIMNFVNLETPQGFEVSNETFQRLVDGLVLAIAQVDMRIKEHVLLVIRLAFTYVKDHQEAMKNFYERDALKTPEENTPNFRKYYKHFDTEMTQILNGITDYDSFCLASSLEKNNKAVRKLGFLLMIAPQPAMRLVFLFCVKSKPLVSSVLWILSRLQPIFQLRVMPTQFQSKEMELFIVTQFRRFLGGEESIDMANEQDRSNIEYLLLLLTKTQFKEKGVLAERVISQHPFFEATELLKDFIADNLTRSFHLDFTLTVLYKMLQSHGGKEWIIKWSQYDFSNETFEDVDPTILITLLVDVHKIENENSKIQKAIVSIFHSLGSKLKADQVRIQRSAFVLSKLNIFDWCQKYFICHSMRDVLVNYKPEIPSVLYNALSDAAKQDFQPIQRLEECSEVEDFTKSIFELAIVSAECALELMKCGFEHPPSNIERVAVADALLRSVRTDTSTKSMQKLMPVVGGLLEFLAGPVTQFSVQRAGAKQLRIIEIFFEAVKLYIINNLGGEDKLSENKFGEEAAVILQSFCENTLHWLTYDLASLKGRKLVFSLDVEGSASEEQVIQLLSDLQKLLYNINFLDHRLCSLPICVKNVRKEILALFSHLYKEFFGSSFDAVQDDNRLENQPPANVNGTSARQIFSNVNNLVLATQPQKSFQNNRRQGNQRKPPDTDKAEKTNGDVGKASKYNKHKNKRRYSNRPEGPADSTSQ